MTPKPKSLADRLLDAQVQFVLDELTGERLAENIARDVDDVLAVAATLTLDDVADAEDVKRVVRTIADRAGEAPLLDDFPAVLADALYDFAASDDHKLGDVLERKPVAALITKVLRMERMHDRALDRLTESPMVATVMSRFVTKVVGDVLAQNRARAEKLPGMSSLFSIGTSAASRMKGVSDQLLGDVTGKSAAYTLRRTNTSIRELLGDEQLRTAALEIWDLHAREPISELRRYLSKKDVDELIALVRELLVSARGKEYVGLLLDECVDVFFEQYGEHDLASLLADAGVTRDDLVDDLRRFVPRLVDAARKRGVLARHVRKRLAPFFHSDEVAALLA